MPNLVETPKYIVHSHVRENRRKREMSSINLDPGSFAIVVIDRVYDGALVGHLVAKLAGYMVDISQYSRIVLPTDNIRVKRLSTSDAITIIIK